jgi:hypothetical protein
MRLRVRTALILVGLVALFLGAITGLARRSESSHRLARYHEEAAGILVVEKVGEGCPDAMGSGEEIEELIAGRGEDARAAHRVLVPAR